MTPLRISLALAALGLVLSLLALLLDATQALPAFHAAALFWLALSAGALPVLMTWRLTGGRWGGAVERVALAIAAPLPVLFAFYVFLLFLALPDLFHWTRPEAELHETVRHKLAYLDVPFLWLRTALVFACWTGLAAMAGCWGGRYRRTSTLPSAFGLVLWVLSVSVFGVDWVMSLEPRWYSDIFGLYLCMSFVVPAAAAAVLAKALTEPRGEVENRATGDFAALLLAAILGWLFLAFAQYLIIWMGNMPDEIAWYVHRTAGTWRPVAWSIAILMAVLPAAMLMSGSATRRRGLLAAVSASVLLGHALHVLWLVLPAFDTRSAVLPWQAFALWLGLGGLWVACVLLHLAPPAHGREGWPEGRRAHG